MNIVISRSQAQAAGSNRYFTGKPCQNAHIAERYVSGPCTVCVQKYRIAQNKRAKQKRARNRKAYRLASKMRYAKKRAQHPEKLRTYWRKRRGLPEPTRPCPERCECCNKLPNGRGSLHLDHDHETRAFRGWLCSSCNTGIGSLGDTFIAVMRAAKYLSRSKS